MQEVNEGGTEELFSKGRENGRRQLEKRVNRTISRGSRRRQVCCVPLRHRINCLIARLLSVVELRTCVDRLLDGTLHVWSRTHDHPEVLLTRAPTPVERLPGLTVGFEFCNPYIFKRDSPRSVLFFTSKPLLVLVISRPKKS